MKKVIACFLVLLFSLLLPGCSAVYSEAPDVKEMETTFSEYKEDFQNITNYLLETPESVVTIDGGTMTVFRTRSDSTELDRTDTPITDTPIAESCQRLEQAGCQSISMDPRIDSKGQENVIYFCMWSRTVDEADGGIAYAINSDHPPQIQFQTALEPLSEDGWYFCLAAYNEWRNTKPTFISTNDEE